MKQIKMKTIKKKVSLKEEPQKGFIFDDKDGKHNYYFDGKLMTGCTSILSVIAKPALIQWAANMASQFIRDNSEDISSFITRIKFNSKIEITNPEIMTGFKILKEETIDKAKNAHRQKKEDAADVGKVAHKIIENWIKTGQITLSEDIMTIKMVLNFINWTTKNKVKFLESEKQIYSKELFIAGTADFVCEIEGKKYIGDIKTGGVYDRIPHFQTAGYRFMLEEMGEKDYFGSIIVNIKKDGSFDETKDVMFSYDYKTDLDGFLAALKIYRILNNY